MPDIHEIPSRFAITPIYRPMDDPDKVKEIAFRMMYELRIKFKVNFMTNEKAQCGVAYFGDNRVFFSWTNNEIDFRINESTQLYFYTVRRGDCTYTTYSLPAWSMSVNAYPDGTIRIDDRGRDYQRWPLLVMPVTNQGLQFVDTPNLIQMAVHDPSHKMRTEEQYREALIGKGFIPVDQESGVTIWI
jgi:hypothetical protein